MLQFFGQLLGISARAGIPLPWDLMPTFWTSLCDQPLQNWNVAKVKLPSIKLDINENMYISTPDYVTN